MFVNQDIFYRRDPGYKKKSGYIILILIGVLGFFQHSTSVVEAADTLKKTLRLGILPDRSQKSIQNRFNPLLQYLQEQTGIETQLVLPDSYEELLQLFKERAVDIAFLGGYSFVKAQREYGAEALVMRDIDLLFTSVFLVRADNDKKSIDEFKGASISFGSRLSTSGHLMPRYFLVEREIIPEQFFNQVLYSGSHDKTAHWVRDGKVELGAANSSVIRQMFKDGSLNPQDLRILWETPVYTDYIWAVQPNLDHSIKADLMDSFLVLSPVHAKHKKILDAQGAGAFLPVNQADFSTLKTIVDLMVKELK